MTTTTSSLLDGYRTQIEEWLDKGKSYRFIVKKLEELGVGTTDRSIRRAVKRWGRQEAADFEDPNFTMEGDEVRLTSEPRVWKEYLNGVDELLKERGLDPEDWEVKSLIVNEWDAATGVGLTLKQLKVHLVRKKKLVMVTPARVALGKIWRSIPYDLDEPELVVFVGDQHAPFQDPDLHQRFLNFLIDQEPDRGILMGDTIDLPNISRHAPEPVWQAKTQECINAGCQIIIDYREASEGTKWTKLFGNHEERLRRSIIDRLGDFYGLKPAEVESLPEMLSIHDPAFLLRLDELEVEYITPKGGYKHANYQVTPLLQARHGDNVRRGSGNSALAQLDGLDHSVVMGHTHRQSLVQKTVIQINNQGRLLQAGETGCMCRIEDGLGYAPGADWSNGFMTASVWPDGTFKLDLATYVDSRLYWRNERY